MESRGSFQLSQWKQCLAAFASTLMINPHVDAVWLSLQSPMIHFEFIYLPLSAILAICGALLAVVCSDFCGRKKIMLATSFFGISRIALILNELLPKNLLVVLIVIHLFDLGFTSTAILLYISEITSTNIRQTAMVLPLVTASIMGHILLLFHEFIKSVQASQIGLSVSVFTSTLFYFIIVLWCPETPYYLNWRERSKETEQSLGFYTGFKYVRTAELIPEPRGNLRTTSFAHKWKKKLRAITEIKNTRNLGMIVILILIKWGIGQQHNIPVIRYILDSRSYFVIVLFTSTIFTSFLAPAIILLSKKTSLLAVIAVSLAATFIAIFTKSPSKLSILIYVKFLTHLIFTGVTWSSAGVLFPTNIKAIIIAILVSLEILLGTIMSGIKPLMYPQDPENYVFWYCVVPLIKSFLDLTTLTVAFVLVLIFSPETIQVQNEETFKNYSVVRSRDLVFSKLKEEVKGPCTPL